jgi:hypothetical protein
MLGQGLERKARVHNRGTPACDHRIHFAVVERGQCVGGETGKRQ